MTTIGVLAVWPTAAQGHEGEGILTVEATTPAAGGLTYDVRLVWENDGHPAIDSTLTATAVAPDGTPQTPVTLQPVDQDGRYRATVPLPGAGPWTIRLTAVEPAATLEVAEQVAPTTTTSAPTTTTTAAPTTTADTGDPTDDGEETAAGGDGGDNGDAAAVFFGALALIAAAGIGVAVRARRSARRRQETT